MTILRAANSLDRGVLCAAELWEYPHASAVERGYVRTARPSRRQAGTLARPGVAGAYQYGWHSPVQEPPPKLLIVGPEINLAGEITACDRLVVEGSVQVTLNQTRAIEITETGRFTNGRAEVDEAEIGGIYEGALTVRGRLLIRATGRVAGTVRYGELEIERGGQLSGTVERRRPEQPSRRRPVAADAQPAQTSAGPRRSSRRRPLTNCLGVRLKPRARQDPAEARSGRFPRRGSRPRPA